MTLYPDRLPPLNTMTSWANFLRTYFLIHTFCCVEDRFKNNLYKASNTILSHSRDITHSEYYLFYQIGFFLKINLFIYLFIFGCVGSSFLCEGFLQLQRAGATLHRGARASHYRALSCCEAQAPDAQAQ